MACSNDSHLPTTPSTTHYYVDEAGDLTLFNKFGKRVTGNGVSTAFILGFVLLRDPEGTKKRLADLRAKLLADPYFKGVPSFQPSARKTALVFHAKDDVSEVRREVYSLLATEPFKVVAIIRRKDALEQAARAAFAGGSKLTDDQIYDDLVKRIFRDRLHKTDNQIVFARRGNSDRQTALELAIEKAKKNFYFKTNVQITTTTTIIPKHPHEDEGLQVIDYCLWALQRLYERGEERYFDLLRPKFGLIIDLDDKRTATKGEWFNDTTNPLSRSTMNPSGLGPWP